MGLDLDGLIDKGLVEVIHRSPTELLQDQLAEDILEAVRRRSVKRLFIDGVDAFKQAAINTNRLGRFFSTLTAILRSEGVTTVFTAELAEIVGGDSGLQFPAVSAIAENILLLRYAELESRLYRTLAILKMRESDFEPYVFEFTLGEGGFRLASRSADRIARLRQGARMSREGQDALAPLVLLVEDELGLSKLMVMILEDEGYRVATASNGAQGLRMLEQERPALIITDYMMPELDGAEMVRAIRRNPAYDGVPILMMSAALTQQIPGRDLVDEFLPKGTGLAPLIDAVRRLTGEGAGSAESDTPDP